VRDNTTTGTNQDGAGLNVDYDVTTQNFTITIVDSTFDNNVSSDRGGAIYVDPDRFAGGGQFTVNISNTTISNNTAVDDAGGFWLNGGDLEHLINITNSTISGNEATVDYGGGLGAFSQGTWFINNSTIVDNTAGDTGGGFDLSTGVVTLNSTIVAGNTAATALEGYDIYRPVVGGGSVTSTTGHNLIGILDGANLTGVVTGNLTGTFATPLDPNLAPLLGNGGLTQTHALCTAVAAPHSSCLVASPAIDAGDNTTLSLVADQRGYTTREDNGTADIGAFETDAVNPNPTTASLAAGDIAVVGWNSTGAGQFSIVTLADIPAYEVTFLTDDGWETPGFGGDLNDSHIRWVVDADGIPAGTILRSDQLTTQGTTSFETGANLITSINLNTAGDSTLIYQTSDNNANFTGSTVSFVYGFNNNNFAATNGWNPTSTATTSSQPPTGLTVVTTTGGAGEAFGLLNETANNYRYEGPSTAADKTTWLQRIHTITNWVSDDATAYDIAPTEIGNPNTSGTFVVNAGAPNALIASIVSGDLVITEVGGDTDDELTISTDGTDIIIADANNTLGDGGISGATGDGTSTLTIPLTAFTGGIIVNSLGGDDTLTVDFGAPGENFAAPITGINFTGGTQNSSVNTAQLYIDEPNALSIAGDIIVQSFRVGDNQAGSHTVNAGQTVTTTGTLLVGRAAVGTLTIESTGNVANNMTVSDVNGSAGSTLTLQNAAALQVTGVTDVGDANNSDGTIDILGGSSLTTNNNVALGQAGNANGDINVTDGSLTITAGETSVTRLQSKIDSGATKLKHDDHFGYLPAVLDALGVSRTSQSLVFSQTSLQVTKISPRRPRAIYFSDNVSVAWVQKSKCMEISAVDPQLRAVFYTLDHSQTDKPSFSRNSGSCLACHATSHTEYVPGHVVFSVFSDSMGSPIAKAGFSSTDHTSPFRGRWGGWYVTGTHDEQRHRGNNTMRIYNRPEQYDVEKGANKTDLSDLFDVTPYLTPHSDLVALMVLEHQAMVQNRITVANYHGRPVAEQIKLYQLTGEAVGSTEQYRLKRAVEDLVDSLLMAREAELTSAIRGTSAFAEKFASLGPNDSKGRSLRQLDLDQKLFRYPCSYLIYSDAFAGLPKSVRKMVYERLWLILTADEPSRRYRHLTPENQRAIIEILKATKPELATEFDRLKALPNEEE
jgi:hypothetical protein